MAGGVQGESRIILGSNYCLVSIEPRQKLKELRAARKEDGRQRKLPGIFCSTYFLTFQKKVNHQYFLQYFDLRFQYFLIGKFVPNYLEDAWDV